MHKSSTADFAWSLTKRTVVLVALAMFTLAESIMAIGSVLGGTNTLSGATGSPHGTSLAPVSGTLGLFWTYSVHLSVGGLIAIGLVWFQGRGGQRSRLRKMFAGQGFSSDIYDLMIGMRGATSRMTLLRTMETPRYRNELSEMTGIDWKEVDRQVGVMEKYGLVKIYAQAGNVKLYQTTEQGRLLLKFIDELGTVT